MRINKYLAHKGLATRRSADTLIASGKVLINGTPATLGQKVLAKDTVTIAGATEQKFRYIIYNKPRGVLTLASTPEDVDIKMRIKKDCGVTGVFPVGRLDKDAEGLILLTDDGRVTERLLNPAHEHTQEYVVRVDARVTPTFLNRLARGVRIEKHITKPADVHASPDNDHVFTISFIGNSKYHIRRMCATLGYHVQSLTRTKLLHLSLKNLKPGAFHELSRKEIIVLKKTLGIA